MTPKNAVLKDNKYEKVKRFYWRGKLVSEKVYLRRKVDVNIGKNIRNIYGTKSKPLSRKVNLDTEALESAPSVVDGRRLVNIPSLAKKMFCKDCGSLLSLEDIVNEKRYGLASIFSIKCRDCKAITFVPTDTQHPSKSSKKMHFDSNTKVAVGVLNAGIGITHLHKILAALNIPLLHWNTFTIHEKEVGQCIQQMALKSCERATLEEKRLTLKNLDKIMKLLPSHLKEDFIIPNLPDGFTYSNIHEISDDNLLTLLVRICVLYDMGWNTKASGRNYDSLTGTGAYFGYFNKKVIAYLNLNRKCRSCEDGILPSKHYYKLNFEGTAKAMEPYAAAQLVKNTIFIKCNVDVGIVGADNDSSAIAAMRKVCKHEIIKHSDKNHTSKGVVSELYRLKLQYKELNGTSVAYLQKCFNYCISQCSGDSEKLAESLAVIPYHCFNQHDKCGDWCKFHLNSDNYVHSTIGEGFKDPRLFESLKCLFDLLASKATEYTTAISTNPCENFNGMIVSFAPKSRLYGMSASGSYRTACAVNKKNQGQEYCVDLNKNLSMSPGRNTSKHATKVDIHRKRRYEQAITVDVKRRRLEKKKEKALLKSKRQMTEGVTYESNCTLLKNLDPPPEVKCIDSDSLPIFVFFDLETSGFSKNADILQIAAKHENNEFSVYIQPTKAIPTSASEVNNLFFINGNLEYNGKKVLTSSLSEAISSFYQFLYKLEKRCVLVAHNCIFDQSRITRAIGKTQMSNHFKNIIAGFCDTLPLTKAVTKRKKKGDNTLVNLANYLHINTDGVHDALCDIRILNEILITLKINSEILLQNTYSWTTAEENDKFDKEMSIAMSDLQPLSKHLSLKMRKRIIAAKIKYDDIVYTFNKYKFVGIKNLLGEDENGKVKVTKSKLIVKDICDCLEGKPKKISQRKQKTFC